MKIEGSQSIISKDAHRYKNAVAYFVYFLFAVIILFGILIALQILNIQIFKHQYYKNVIANARQTSNVLAPRGKIFDRNGKLLVTNEEDIIVQYFPVKPLNDEEKWEIAKRFANQFNVKAILTTREEKDLFIYLNRKTIFNDRFTKEELKKLDPADLDTLILDKIQETDLKSLSQTDKNTFSVIIAMNFASQSRFSVIKRGLTKEEAAFLVENKELYPGFIVEFDWKRKYLEKDLFKSVLGKVSNETQGLPIEESAYLLANGYQLNEKIGITGLEKQYETYLRGQPNVYEISSDESGHVSKKYLKEGQNGSDLYLTIDIELQKKLNQILADQLQFQKTKSGKLEHAMVSIMDVETGEVLGMASQSLDLDKKKESSYDSASLAYLYGFSPGSSVKGATIYMGLDTGVVKPGEIILDAPLHILGTPIKKSIVNMGLINELDALQRSSNVYMFHIAIRMGKSKYVPHQSLVLDPSLVNDIRHYFTSFGLGSYTMLDVPNEALAFTGHSSNVNNALDYVIGQYDQYTLIQMNQYVNTLATKGIRLKPYLVKKIMNNKTEIQTTQKEVLGIVPGNHQFFDNVHEGFSRTGKVYQQEKLAQKTGTADVENHYTTNTVVSFGPKDKPKISVACVVPFSYDERIANSSVNPCTTIVGKVYEAYGSLYPFKK